jgi:hypothetical protein
MSATARQKTSSSAWKVEAGARNTQVPDTTVTISHGRAFPPLTENAQIDALAARARAIYAEIGKTVALSGNGGASESALTMSAGTPALDGLGFVGGDFHTDHEWVDLASVDTGDPERDVDAHARKLVGEVDALARVYGWTEPQILALSPQRRATYLAMVQG